jgi:hypothetical protein
MIGALEYCRSRSVKKPIPLLMWQWHSQVSDSTSKDDNEIKTLPLGRQIVQPNPGLFLDRDHSSWLRQYTLGSR